MHSGRTPHGVRGLKYSRYLQHLCADTSHPARGAWIEIVTQKHPYSSQQSRTPHGVRGLKSVVSGSLRTEASRTPHGVRGLKYPQITCSQGLAGRTPHGVRGLK